MFLNWPPKYHQDTVSGEWVRTKRYEKTESLVGRRDKNRRRRKKKIFFSRSFGEPAPSRHSLFNWPSFPELRLSSLLKKNSPWLKTYHSCLFCCFCWLKKMFFKDAEGLLKFLMLLQFMAMLMMNYSNDELKWKSVYFCRIGQTWVSRLCAQHLESYLEQKRPDSKVAMG